MFRFTIRDVLWLTVVVALVVGWRLDRNRLASQSLKSYAAFEALSDLMRQEGYDFTLDGGLVWITRPDGSGMAQRINHWPATSNRP